MHYSGEAIRMPTQDLLRACTRGSEFGEFFFGEFFFLMLSLFYIRVTSYRENSRKQKKNENDEVYCILFVHVSRLVFFFFIFIRTKFEVLKEGHK
jgi:hypothetical protein